MLKISVFWTSLHITVDEGDSVATTLLLKKGAFLSSQSLRLVTPLHLAAKKDFNLYKLLVVNGADQNLVSHFRETPRDIALQTFKHDSGAQEFFHAVKNGPLRELFKNPKMLPIHRASRDFPHCLESLMELGALCELRDLLGNSALHHAILGEQLGSVSILLSHGANATAKNNEGNTALHLAVKNRYQEGTVSLLRHSSALAAIANEAGELPLHVAAGSAEFINLLAPVSPLDAANGIGETTLHYVVNSGDVSALKALLTYTPSIDAANEKGEAAVHYAVKQPHLLEALLNAGADVEAKDMRDETPLHRAAEVSLEAIRFLVSKKACIDATSKVERTPLFNAIEHSTENALYLISLECDVNQCDSHGLTPLMMAARYNPLCVEPLLAKGARIDDKDAQERTAVHHAAIADQPKSIALLRDHGAELDGKDKDEGTPLYHAEQNNAKECVRLLKQSGVNTKHVGTRSIVRLTGYHKDVVNKPEQIEDLVETFGAKVKTENDQLPLHVAARQQPLSLVALLKYSDPLARDFYGATAAHHAARYNVESSKILLRHYKTYKDEQDNDGAYPLHYASQMNNVPCTALFLECGAEVNAVDHHGSTALHYAAWYGAVECCDLLLQKGAAIDKENEFGETALDIAFAKNEVVIKLLLLKGALVKLNRVAIVKPILIAPIAEIPVTLPPWKKTLQWELSQQEMMAALESCQSLGSLERFLNKERISG